MEPCQSFICRQIFVSGWSLGSLLSVIIFTQIIDRKSRKNTVLFSACIPTRRYMTDGTSRVVLMCRVVYITNGDRRDFFKDSLEKFSLVLGLDCVEI
jgi:hypothetical protein